MGAVDIERSADPTAVRRTLDQLADVDPARRARVDGDPELRATVTAVTGASPWLARLCLSDPVAVDVLAAIDDPSWSAPEASDLARQKRLGLLRVAARDLTGRDGLEAVGTGLSDLAEDLVRAATAEVDDRLAVVAMGKLGAGELNYASDIDLLLVGPMDQATVSEARHLLEVLRTAWRVDVDLRPEGRAGSLVRSIDSYLAYWDRWAAPWEFQALLKARPVAGDPVLGARFVEEAAARVWGRPFGADELRVLRDMKRRAEAEVTRLGLTERELKRGRGGIRDIEFAVQLLQLVHGRADPALRAPATLAALDALAVGGYVDPGDASALADAYRFFRTVEHRLQLAEDQPVHVLPADAPARERLARVLGYRDDWRATARERFEADLRRHQATGRSIHERLYFRPLLEAFTAAPRVTPLGPAAPLGPEATATRLAAFGFSDAARTRQAVTELTRGFSRSSSLMRQLLPLIFEWLSQAPDPDLGLLGLRSLTTGAHRSSQLTAVFRESAEAARQLCLLLGTGSQFLRAFEHHPDLMLRPGTSSPASASTVGTPHQAASLQRFHQREMLRIAADDVLGRSTLEDVGQQLTGLAERTLQAAVAEVDPDVPMAVIAMGRLGGGELSYGSDLDLLFVYDSDGSDDHALRPEAPAVAGPVGAPLGGRATTHVAPVASGPAVAAEAAAGALMRLISGDTPARRLYEVDAGLRPEGRQGPLARSLAAHATYYRRWARPWERQALLRGRFVAGDPTVGARFATLARAFVWDHPFDEDDLRDLRRVKARVEGERVPSGEDAEFHLKLGPGSLADVEWTVQLLQLIRRVPACGTIEALVALVEAGALSPEDADVLTTSYRFCEQARNRLYLVKGARADALPTTGHLLSVLARSMGTSPTELREEYRRLTRRARRVVDRLFWGA